MMENYNNNNNSKLNSNFVTGLTDGQGCFLLLAPKNYKSKFKVYFILKYKISILKNEVELLKMVKSFFNCGVLSHNNYGTIYF